MRKTNFFEPIKDIFFRDYYLNKARITEDGRYVLIAYGADVVLDEDNPWDDGGWEFPREVRDPILPVGNYRTELARC